MRLHQMKWTKEEHQTLMEMSAMAKKKKLTPAEVKRSEELKPKARLIIKKWAKQKGLTPKKPLNLSMTQLTMK